MTATSELYRVTLATFRGPMDLLLYLVKRHEVDILDIPIATVATQFAQYLQVIENIDVEAAGDFLVMAATLMELKSRMLLPQTEEEADDTVPSTPGFDPRSELVKQLLEYRKYRDASDRLEQLAETQSERWFRTAGLTVQSSTEKASQIHQVELWDLVGAFDRLLRATLHDADQKIKAEEISIQNSMQELLSTLEVAGEEKLSFEALFPPPHTRNRLIGLFLAILELIKQRQINVEQEYPLGPIWVSRRVEASEEPALVAA